MAKYRADVDETRYYPTLGVLVNPNDVVDLPEGIDAAGLVAETKSKKSVEPASDDAVAEGVTN